MMSEALSSRINGIDTEAMKKTMQEISMNREKGIARFTATTVWKGGTCSETHIDGWELGGRRLPKNFSIRIDEPPELLGGNTAANPQEYLMAAVNACMMATYVGTCSMHGIQLDSVEIEMTGRLDLRGFLGLDKSVSPGYEELDCTVRIQGDGAREQYEMVHQWVMATSPNYWNIVNPIRMKPRLVVG
jgi:uncharacterized OsmC-like protein